MLVTSRQGEWDRSLIEPIKLETLRATESRRLLKRLSPQLSDEEADLVAETLGHFPLALHLAGSFLRRYRTTVSVSDYLAVIKQAPLTHPSLEGRGAKDSPTNHEQHVANTFAVSWDRLNDDDHLDQLAKQMLIHAAQFAPGLAFPTEILDESLSKTESEEGDDQNAPPDPLDVADARLRLNELGFLKVEDDLAELHRLVSHFVNRQAKNEIALAEEKVAQALISAAYEINKAGYPAPLRPWSGHLAHMIDQLSEVQTEQVATLCINLGYHYNQDGRYSEAEPLFVRALAIREESLGAAHPDTASTLWNLAELYKTQERISEAIPLFERELSIIARLSTTDLNSLFTRMFNLINLYGSQNLHRKAESLMAQALQLAETNLEEEHQLVQQLKQGLQQVRSIIDQEG